ncbi:MJ0570-related uncharacterized domain-containing protein [Halobacillus karajensis]|uniref:-related uncharacterized domain protein n=1 Tax=Halobacillus karajensis TaxID=195088 RepID=A0A024P5R4_9BACI|nr:diphthine--ammonia ligase [Halobacillus karajensis]CDQ20525.1 -related uncharacterized domain protein [Halobacillus karajensis]CDQ24006.1 -related uncharacterized domain protein [Halobacillus karajensis]CDQ27484.1 -related uncharacterized domain protein [Halobacillus karajensis]SEH90391.1 MJ0570-related uncharacterized domain-containing protein [Halobacillus karajensis]
MPEKVMVSWSGGKDSALALYKMMQDEHYNVEGIFSTISAQSTRLPVHEVKQDLLKKQAEAMGLPLKIITLPPHASNERYEQEMDDLFHYFKARGINHIVYADLFLEDIKAYRDQLVEKFGMKGLYPLWGMNSKNVAEHLIEQGFRAVITTVDTEKMDNKIPGVQYDPEFLSSLSSAIDPCGEYGEFHSFVYDGPMFKDPVKIVKGPRFHTFDGRFAHIEMEEK